LVDDVAIVGAGPAGAWAAYALARAGARVTIFDPSHPREKPCGGGVTGRALAIVGDAIGSTGLDRSIVRSARFLHHSAASAVPLEPDALVVASRAAFDAALLDAAQRAGASLVVERVVDVHVDASRVRVDTAHGEHRASFLMGADGANSLVRRRVARAFRREQLSIATGFYAHGLTSDEIVVEFVADPPGYIWSFPRPDHLAIGICAQANAGSTSGELRARTFDWLSRTRVARGHTRLEPYAWPIPSLSAADFDAIEVAGPRWCLLGDAAGLVDPITREGIYFALRSGQSAAEALAAAHPAREFTAHVRDEVVGELARAAHLKDRFFQPPVARLLMKALQQSARVRAVMADLIAGRQEYRSLKWRLLKTLEIGLAIEAFATLGRVQREKYPSRARTRTPDRLTVTSIERQPGSPPRGGV
jgi:geranylgeranyl reductase family protein